VLRRIWFGLPLLLGCSGGATATDVDAGPCGPLGSANAPAPADAAPDDAADAGGCNAEGTWALVAYAAAQGGCASSFDDRVALVVSAQVAAEGGTVSDSEGNTWTFDPASCSASLGGACDASDSIDFSTFAAQCSWTCGGACPALPATCMLERCGAGGCVCLN
jgi:hypothetical protein